MHAAGAQAGRELGLAGETLHDAAQLLDRAACLGLLPAAAAASPGSEAAAVDGAAGNPVAPADVPLVGAALLIACKSRAHTNFTAAVVVTPRAVLDPYAHPFRCSRASA